MYNLKMLPYNQGSESARDLAKLLGCLRVKPDGNYAPQIGHHLLNWGYSGTPEWMQRAQARGVRVLNAPARVNVAGNKLSTFNVLQANGITIPEFTTDMNQARRWVDQGNTVLERHELRGNSGAGIRIVNLDDDRMPSHITQAPLYTKFINKTNEFRVHVFRGQVIDYVEKKRLPQDRRPVNFNKYVSSTHQGWVFQRTNVLELANVKQVAIDATRALGLDFAAVDVVYSDGIAYVLECNTAPGLGGVTLMKYANAVRGYMGLAPLREEQQTRPAEPMVINRPIAAPVAHNDGDMVTLVLNRTLARQLRQLLANV